MQFDVVSLGDHLPDPHTGFYNETQAERFQFWVELGHRADKSGYGAIWLGEHHCCDYIGSSPQMVLASIAMRSEKIRLGTAVSLLPNHDPVRLAEEFATLDLLSQGRAEIGFGSGYTAHTFDLFGQNMDDMAEISAENLSLLRTLWDEKEISWSGKFRAPIEQSALQPRTFSGRSIPINIATASNEENARNAGRNGYKLMLMTVVGQFADMRYLADAYRDAYRQSNHDPAGMSVAAVAYVHVQSSGQAARDTWFPYRDNYRAFTKLLTESKGLTFGVRELSKRIAKERFIAREADLCGDSNEVTAQILKANTDLGGVDRLICYVDCGGMAGPMVLDSVELFADTVMSTVNDALAS
ncbi:MAG: alkanesulfonate monooxygenase SsuD [Gammaproteobacteria bacterium]|jgi:alkanesulfonate monooxygenase SsuD/methylene tetrahydromethanopterin reductase-like flavin-dependent oxidoreductase (luciferase family)